MKQRTEQEEFWSGDFGDNYANRNSSEQIIAGNLNLFSQIISHTSNVESILEFGANIGMNLLSLKQLLPNANYTAVEINKSSCKVLSKYSWINVKNESALDINLQEKYSFVLTKGLLIHINPDALNDFYKTIYDASSKYICLVEYYNPVPVELSYRGFSNKLFKRDFAGEMLKMFPDLKLLKYGFSYHLDNNFPQDDLNWFLMEKQ
jgi:pseudaminic acid biosynthesis-associated methylase